MVRFMTLNSPKGMITARVWYYVWFVLFYSMATAVGMLSRIYLPAILQSGAQGFDAELALPTMAQHLLPPAMVGLVLAGIFAATMSTADSLILSCSAFITQDLWPRHFSSNARIKIATVLVTAAALAWALLNRESVFALVVLSWSMLGACFVPIILVLIFGGKLRSPIALLMSISACSLVFILHWWGYDDLIYGGMPAIALGLLIYAVDWLFGPVKKLCL
jgi:sodium/proline symporter